jgi:hypothetical protein
VGSRGSAPRAGDLVVGMVLGGQVDDVPLLRGQLPQGVGRGGVRRLLPPQARSSASALRIRDRARSCWKASRAAAGTGLVSLIRRCGARRMRASARESSPHLLLAGTYIEEVR